MSKKNDLLNNTYVSVLREDFSLFIAPKAMANLNLNTEPRDDIDRSHTSEKGFVLSSRSKRKIRSAVYSLYCRADRAEQRRLRFVTFTFPPLPPEYSGKSQQEQDSILHSLFKKFIDNERKPFNGGRGGSPIRLERYVWVNERQDGERLKGIVEARNVLHYHCLFRYSGSVDYYTCNIRWLNLLLRNGFEIFNKAFLEAHYKERREHLLKLLRELDYKGIYEIRETLKIPVLRVPDGVKDESVFLQPVDFDRKVIENVESLGKYLSAYLTKEVPHENLTDEEKISFDEKYKIYARRWNCSRGLVIQKDEINQQFTQACPHEIINEQTGGCDLTIVDEETGEVLDVSPGVLTTLNQELILSIYRLDKIAYVKKIIMEVGGQEYECYYLPPRFKIWSQIPVIKDFFKTAFNYNLI